ncbi:hypothetical protein [Leisingera sp. ANG-Vp]|uniref:hypothetical protein n=1 Tax=Leisingera sp. ANG-Vp TaxID=1577896 RepID=UPI00057E9C00|nr:hypothetical protein [Leisingera sp. ANG-Vp]KIC15143.1 hypothetical protein RA20_19035 [Leisingera sp. ANG-Vp]
MKKLFLHIGFNKTGSTSIQRNLVLNAAALQQRGILYPNDPAAPFMQNIQHVPLAGAMPNHYLSWLTPAKRATLDRAYSSLTSHLEARDFHTLVLSSEGFGSPATGLRKAAWVKEQFAAYDVTVIAYIRRQDAYFLSAYQEEVKAGCSTPFCFDSYPDERILRFAQRLKPWRRVFGADKVAVRPFDRRFWPEGELFYDFLSILGASREGLALAPPQNEGLDYRAVGLLQQLNQISGAAGGGQQLRHRNRVLIQALARLQPEDGAKQKMQLSTEQIRILRRHFRAGNERALAGSGITPAEFFPPPPRGQQARLQPPPPETGLLLQLLSDLADLRSEPG